MSAPTPAAVREWLVRMVAGLCALEVSDVDVDRPLREYGLGSREALQLAGELDELLDTEIPVSLFWDHPTIAGLADALADLRPGPAPAAVERVDAAEPIAVIGLGCRLPGGVHGPEEFWELLRNGRDGITEVPGDRWEQFGHDSAEEAEVLSRTAHFGGFLDDVAGFDAEFFGIAPREARVMDPQQRLLLEVAWEAWEHAGLAPERLRGTATGVFVGVNGNEYSRLTLGDLSRVDAWTATGAAVSVAANRLSYAFDLRGPSVAVDTACSSSLVAVHLAMQSLRAGESEVALAAGANLVLGPAITASFDRMGVTAPDGRCKAFAAAADGIGRGEGAAVVILKPLRAAVRDADRVLAVLRGSAVNSDGRSNGLTGPSPQAQQDMLSAACSSAGADPAEVDYVETHGTGTPLGDPIEAGALGAVLGGGRPADRPLLIGSVKTNLGHLEAAAGIAGLVKVVLALTHGSVPASLHFDRPNPLIPFEDLGLAVVTAPQAWPVRDRPALAGVSAFGFGGTNAHVVVEQAPDTRVMPAPLAGPGKYVLAAASLPRLRAAADRLNAWLAGAGSRARPSDVEHSMARRASGRWRAVVSARTRAELTAGLRAVAGADDSGSVALAQRDRSGRGPVWVFSGLGSQWPGMGRRLLAAEPAFAAAVAEIDEFLPAETGRSLRAMLECGVAPDAFEEQQLRVFGMQVALARLWESHGMRPSAIIGHSLGEVAAAVAAGGLSLADGVRVAARRARCLATTAGTGAMAVLELAADEVGALLADHPSVDIAAYNAPRLTVVAGTPDGVRELVSLVERRGLLARLIDSTVAGHCRLVADAAEALHPMLEDLTARPPSIPLYPTATDDPRASPLLHAGYWAGNIRRPVRFTQAVAAALEDGFTTFVEIAPHPVLLHAIGETVGTEVTCLATVRRTQDEADHFHATLAALLARGHGAPVTAGRLLDLPVTAWQHTRHWPPAVTRTSRAGEHPLLGKHIEHPESGIRLWQADLGTRSVPWLADHRIDGRAVLPAACYVEMAFAAASTALGVPADRLVLTNLTMYQPLFLDERTPVTATFEDGRFVVHAKDSAGEWIRYCDVSVTADPASAESADVEADSGSALTATELYDRLRSLGIDYGPAFRSVTGAHTAEQAAVTTLRLPDAAPVAGFAVHPVLVDACLQGFAAVSTVDETRYAPMMFGGVRLYGDVRDGVRAQVRVATAGPEAVGSLRLVDQEGRSLLDITDVVLRRLSAAEVTTPLRDGLLAHVWRQADEPDAGEIGPVLLVSDRRFSVIGRAMAAFASAEVSAVLAFDVERELLQRHRPSDVVVLVDQDGRGDPEDGQRAVLAAVERVRVLASLPVRPPRLWLVTFGAAAVLDGEAGDPGAAALRGLIRVLSYEHPDVRTTWLDLDPDRAEEGLVRELRSGSADDEVAWRDGDRYVGRLEPVPAPEPGKVPVVRADGGYVVTGGLGGLGLTLAAWLAARGARTIVLNGRSAPTPAAAAEIDRIRAAGTTVEVVLGDIADPGVAERLIAAAGEVRGVAHAAAVFGDRTVAQLDEETLRATWRPKAEGAWRLHEASAGRELDWWLVFSSATALHGLPGQPAYASANAYVDALMVLRRAGGLPGTSVNWGTWAEVGAAADIDVPWLRPISPGEGLALLSDVLSSGASGLGAVRLKPRRLVADFPALRSVPLLSGVLGQERAGAGGWPGLAALRDHSPAEIRRLVGEQLAARVAAVLDLPPGALADDVPLIGLGVDSLLAVRIRNAVQHDFDVTLPLSLLLRGADMADLREEVHTGLEIGGIARRTLSSSGLVRPRDAAERLVAATWQEVLGVPVGATDEFAALGGDEAKAERIAATLSTRTGATLSVPTLFAQPTVELMAAVLREADTTSGPVRVLRGSGTQRPLFFFHPGGGNTAVFRQLVDLLPPDVPAYGLDRVEGTATVEQRVKHYLPELRRLQPSGPYRLAGWSFGGFLAFETAQQLVAAGEEVELLGLVDPILPLPPPAGLSEVDLMRLRLERYGEFLRATYGGQLELPFAELAELDDEAQADLLVAKLLAAGVVDERVSEAILTHQRQSYLDARLLERYQPAPWAGPVSFYSAADPVPGGLRDPRFDRTDPARGWDAVCDDLDLVSVPGHHLSVLDTPHVEVIAHHLSGLLK